MLGSLPIRGVSTSPQQVDVVLTACSTPAAISTAPLDASPASPRLFSSTALPHTPPSQLLRAVSSPPPVRRLRNTASPPPASHPILSSAITVACTIAPDATRLPIQRQLAFPVQNTPSAQQASPFAAAETVLEPPSLWDKINGLPGPQQLLRSVLTDNKASFSQDSGMLTHMLHCATLFPTESDSCVVGSSSVGSACSLPVAPEDAASPKRSRPAILKAPAPHVSKCCVDGTEVNTLLGSSRSAFCKTAFISKAYVSKSQGTAYGGPTPSPGPHPSPQDALKGIPMRNPQGRTSLQHAATVPRWPLADSMFRFASAGPVRTQPAQTYPGKCSATALAHSAPKGCLLSATATPGRCAKPIGSFSDSFDFQSKVGKAVRATQNSPWGPVSSDPRGCSHNTDCDQNPSVSRSGLFLKAPLADGVLRVNSSSPSNLQGGRDVLTPPADIRSAHTLTTHAQKLSPPFTGSSNPAQPIERASLSKATGFTASNKSLPGWCPPHNTLDYRAAAGNFATHAGLECRLTLPHGTRVHKRPRLEDKLKEQRMLRAESEHRAAAGGIQ